MPKTLTREAAIRIIGEGFAAPQQMVADAIAGGMSAEDFALQASEGGRGAIQARQVERRRQEVDALAREIDGATTAWSR